MPRGLPHLGLPTLDAGAAVGLLGTAVSLTVVILARSSATARAYAAKYEEEFSENGAAHHPRRRVRRRRTGDRDRDPRSIVDHLRHSYDPRSIILVPHGRGYWRPVPASAGERTAPGLVVYRFGSGLYYANAHELLADVTAFAHDGKELHTFCLDFVATGDVDVTAGRS